MTDFQFEDRSGDPSAASDTRTDDDDDDDGDAQRWAAAAAAADDADYGDDDFHCDLNGTQTQSNIKAEVSLTVQLC